MKNKSKKMLKKIVKKKITGKKLISKNKSIDKFYSIRNIINSKRTVAGNNLSLNDSKEDIKKIRLK
jgi:hypothetical protein